MTGFRRMAFFQVGAAAMLLAAVWAAPALGGILVQNHVEASIEAAPGPRFYAYGDGSVEGFDADVEFDTGTYIDTMIDGTGTLVRLTDAPTIAWWDLDWGHRRCFEASNPGAPLTEHPVRVELDTIGDIAAGLVQPDGDDYRALAADDTTLLDLWVEGPMNDPATVIWVQLDVVSGTTGFCLYFDNPAAATVSSQASVFTFSTPQQLYFPAYYRLDGSNQNNGRLEVVSYVDSNTVTIGATTRSMDAGDTFSFKGVSELTQIWTTGPIGARGRGDGMDSVVPLSFAGTEMVFPTNRGTQRWTIVAPYGIDAEVEIYNGTVLAWSGTVGATAVTPTVDIGGVRSAAVISTNDEPIIVTHTATQAYDALAVPPFLGEDLFGVRSRGTWIGVAEGPASMDIFRSDSTSQAITGLAAGSVMQIYDAGDASGDGTAIRITNMSDSTAALQQADRDGLESTAYLPESLLEDLYYLPTAADYIAFACPTSTTIDVGGNLVPCNAPAAGYPGHGWHGSAGAGTRIASTDGSPFFAYYEDSRNDDETNLFGMKAATPPVPVPVTVVQTSFDTLPTAPTSGTWTSPMIDTLATGSGVLGLLSASTDEPIDTSVSIRIASGPTSAAALTAPFLGPDGTAATSYGSGETPLRYGHDFTDRYFVIRTELGAAVPGTTPTVDLISLGYDLPEVFDNSVHAIDSTPTAPATSDSDWVLRVWTEDPALAGATATLEHIQTTGTTAASNASIVLEPTTQIVVSGGLVTQTFGAPVAIGPAIPHSVRIDTEAMAGTVIDMVWTARVSGTGILIDNRAQLVIS